MNLYGFMSDIKALAGMLFGMNPKSIITYSANENVDYGKALFMKDGKVANKKNNNKAVLDISAYTTASKNIIAKINGVTVTTLVTTGTIADDVATLVDSINDEVEGVIATVGTSNKVNVASEKDGDLTVELSYDGSDVTSSKVTLSTDFIYVGFAVFHQNSFENARGYYVPTEAVNCLEAGYIWAVLATDVTPKDGDIAYVTNNGLVTTSSSGTTQIGKFKSGAEDGLALIDVIK